MRSIASRMSVMSGEGALSVFAHAKELESQGRSIIHLELGEPDFHPGASVVESATKALADGKDRYCAVAGVPALREEIAAYLQRTRNISVSAADIVIAPGCKAALFFAMMSLLEPGDEVLYPDPGFPGYPSITLGLGAVPVPFELSPRNHFQPDLSEIASKITRRTRMLITNSPGNPTGTVYTDAVQRGLAELAVKHDLWVLSDEIYARIIYGDEYLSMLRYRRDERTHGDHRRLFEKLCHDRMAPGLRGRAARGGGSAGHDGDQQLHLCGRIHPIRRHRCPARSRRQHSANGRRVCAAANSVCR